MEVPGAIRRWVARTAVFQVTANKLSAVHLIGKPEFTRSLEERWP